MSRILVTESNPRAKTFFSSLEREGHQVVYIDGVPTEDELSLYKDINILSVFVNTKVTEKVVQAMPDLKLIITRSTGIDHINTRAATESKIAVANVPGYGVAPVAEHTFALLLSLLRNVVRADTSVRSSLWESYKFQGTDILGKTFGVIGTGAIGTNVCKIAKGFGASVIAYDVIKREDAAKEIGFTYVELDELYRKSDIISLHIPLLKETQHLVNADALAKMKDGVIIINTARGPIMDYKALVEALKAGKVGGAGLDVFESEPLEPDSELPRLKNTVLTPHIAWYTVEAEIYILEQTLNTIREFLAGKTPKNIIT